MQTDIVLAKLDTARKALAEAKTIQETKKILDVAAAAEILAKRQKLGEEAVQYATSIKVEALAQLGRMLKDTELNEGGRPTKTGNKSVPVFTPTLADLGLDKRTSKLAQDIAALPEEKIEAVKQGVLSISKSLREAAQEQTRATRKAQSIPDGKYSLIYADPPWRYDFSQSESREIENHYPTMEVEDICKLPIGSLADDNCVLFLWATNPKLREALRVVEAWGFEYKTNMVWVKDKIGMGYYARQKHEILLIATKGDHMTPPPDKRPESVLCADRTKHSRKPLEFYDLLEYMYPTAKRIELFSRLDRKGWNAWGNE